MTTGVLKLCTNTKLKAFADLLFYSVKHYKLSVHDSYGRKTIRNITFLHSAAGYLFDLQREREREGAVLLGVGFSQTYQYIKQ